MNFSCQKCGSTNVSVSPNAWENRRLGLILRTAMFISQLAAKSSGRAPAGGHKIKCRNCGDISSIYFN